MDSDALRRSEPRAVAGILLGLLQFASLAGAADAQTPAPKHEIKTQPPGAEVYLDWHRLGETPLTLDAAPRAGSFLVVMRDGFEARYRTFEQPRSFYFRLSPAQETSHRRVLLRVLGPESTSFQELLVEELAERDFFVHPEPDVTLLEKRLLETGDRAKQSFLAWAGAELGTHHWIVVRLPGVTPDLDLSSLLVASPAPADAAEADEADDDTARVRVVDLRHGTLDETFEVESRSFYSRHSWKRRKAEEQLAESIAETLREWIEAKMQMLQPEPVTAVDLDEVER